MTQTFFAKNLLTGQGILHDQVVVVEDGLIKTISTSAAQPRADFYGEYLAPSFIDLQVYGAREKLFSLYPTADTLKQMYAHCLESGTGYFLATIATNTKNVLFSAIDAARAYSRDGGKGLIGLHLEGPWINPARRGAHIASYIETPTVESVHALLEYGRDVIKIITLAPEICSDEIIDLIRSFGIIISAGHSDATFQEATDSFSKGIRTVTHLFNAMSPFHHRDTGLPGATFAHPTVMASIIVDGFHIDYAAVKIAKQLMGDRLFLITDAVTETNVGPYPHTFSEGRYLSDGTLSGSAITMLDAVKNCIRHCGISVDESFKMASVYPARLMGMPCGINLGEQASFLLLDDEFNVVKTLF